MATVIDNKAGRTPLGRRGRLLGCLPGSALVTLTKTFRGPEAGMSTDTEIATDHPLRKLLLFGFGCLGPVLLLMLVMPRLFHFGRGGAAKTDCQSNLQQIGTAFRAYVQDHNSVAPPAADWPAALAPYTLSQGPSPNHPVDYALYTCPLQPAPGAIYGYNDTARGAAGVPASWVANPAGLLTCLDYTGARVGPVPPTEAMLANAAIARHTGLAKIVDASGQTRLRRRPGVNCLFFDGHVQWLRPAQAAAPG